MRIGLVAIWAALAQSALSQTGTHVDLKTETRRVDFTNADSTRLMKLATRAAGHLYARDLFFKADAPKGANLFGCAGTNPWTGQGSASIQLQSDVMVVGTRASTWPIDQCFGDGVRACDESRADCLHGGYDAALDAGRDYLQRSGNAESGWFERDSIKTGQWERPHECGHYGGLALRNLI